ncbi:hypothetical protein TIFTF001_016829 [Ficus carica]|uniref:Uncharacterized protein n=1 Tax=Ficus carica TaxID=3494 RepID=A0AA88A3U9_FICCA|nr:hypothetical protein TIFTF001_016829 [Ficus carica]
MDTWMQRQKSSDEEGGRQRALGCRDDNHQKRKGYMSAGTSIVRMRRNGVGTTIVKRGRNDAND